MLQKKKMLVLLAGQSNMAGRGAIEPEDLLEIPGLYKFTAALQWEAAAEPLHFDRAFAGTGPGRTFGRLLLLSQPDCPVGLVPCAVGGSPISAWRPGVEFQAGEHPYDDTIRRARAAQAEGEFAAILWHQGESDAKTQNPDYALELRTLVLRLRAELGLPELPFICGELGQFLGPEYLVGPINAATRAVVAELPRMGYVSAAGLESKGDQLHFSSASARELGRRYFEAFQALR
ncbi:MAG: sialate O-acetylesterase [Oligosphaeraceae bacterium]|nr:sialate O-acetylesterase [Oligosphaeraceae bacterium]